MPYQEAKDYILNGITPGAHPFVQSRGNLGLLVSRMTCCTQKIIVTELDNDISLELENDDNKCVVKIFGFDDDSRDRFYNNLAKAMYEDKKGFKYLKLEGLENTF